MGNFTPDDIFKAAFSSTSNVTPNNAMWHKLQAQLLQKANATKQKKRNNIIALAACILFVFLGTGGYLSLRNINPNSVVIRQIQPTTLTANNNNIILNNLINNNSNSTNNSTNNNANYNTNNSVAIYSKALIINNNLLTNNNLLQYKKNVPATTYNVETLNIEPLNSTTFNNTQHLNQLVVKPKIINHPKIVVNKLNNNLLNTIQKPINKKGNVSKGIFVGGNIVKSYDKNVGYTFYIQHHKHISTQVALTSGLGLVKLPTEYKYKKVAFKEGLPTELDAKLFNLSLVYFQMGVTYYPLLLNKRKPNFAINIFAMPGIITAVDATTNANDPEVNKIMKMQINRMHFLAGFSLSKSISKNLWVDAGLTSSFSTLTNGVFLNKTNSVNNILYTQVGIKYKIK